MITEEKPVESPLGSVYYCDHAVNRLRADTKHVSSQKALRALCIVSVFTVFFIAAEFVGGVMANSLAIMTDAFHMVSDLASFGISIMAILLARRKPTYRYSYGYQRAEVLGAFASIILIWLLTVALVYMAIERIARQEYEVDPDIMMITAAVGIVFNIIIGILLHFGQAEHSHFGVAHHHHHDSEAQVGYAVSPEGAADAEATAGADIPVPKPRCKRHNHSHAHGHGKVNINIRAAFVHVLGDLVQAVGVFIAAVIIKFTGYEIADPICTFIFSLLVLITTVTVMLDALKVLMECAPAHIKVKAVKRDLLAINGVLGVHSLRIWSLKMDTCACSVHVDTMPDADVSVVVFEANQVLQHKYGVDFVTVQAKCTPPHKDRCNSITTILSDDGSMADDLSQ